MNRDAMYENRFTHLAHHRQGQSMVEFALILPLFVLLLVGIFDVGRAFFALIAISNAAREGTRVYTFKPATATISDINNAIDYEIGSNSVVDTGKIVQREIRCVNPATNTMEDVPTQVLLEDCKSEAPIRVTLTYQHDMILSFFFPGGITMVRSTEMMVP